MGPLNGKPVKEESSLDAIYRGRQVAGLLLVAVCVLLFALFRTNWHELFPTGWWRF